MINYHTKAFTIILSISLVIQFVFVMQFIHPIKIQSNVKHSYIKETISKKHNSMPTLPEPYTPSINDIDTSLTLAAREQGIEVSADSIFIPDGIETKSVSNNDYEPGTYKFIVGEREVGTIVIYSAGKQTVIKTDGIHNDYPSISLSSDSFYASNLNVKLQKQ